MDIVACLLAPWFSGKNPDSLHLTLDRVLEHQHDGEFRIFDGQVVDMRAEVAILTRSVVFEGANNPEDGPSETNMYGAHIMVHSPGDDTSVARLVDGKLIDGASTKFQVRPRVVRLIPDDSGFGQGNASFNFETDYSFGSTQSINQSINQF
jgi:hypothetical protein